MLFSRQWLGRYVELPDDVDDLCQRLTAAGFNVEHVRRVGDDLQLDLEITTNRSDAMNHLGLARELAVVYDSGLLPPEVDTTGCDRPLDGCEISVDDLGDCPRYAARVVRGVTVGPSPDWLVERLESIGQRSINNIVDVTNFVLWETGQPLHAFDLATLAGPAIRVRRARDGESLTTLDGEERELDAEILVIADAERAVALAGIMGGLDTEVGRGTSDVLIESAHFELQRVRRGANRLGMSTDASFRFERGTDPELCLWAATRAAELMAEVAGGEIAPGAADVRDAAVDWRPHGRLDRASLCRFAGVEIPADEIERILDGLGYELTRDAASETDDAWSVRVPSWRYYDCEAWRPTEKPVEKTGDPPGDATPGGGAPRVWEADLYEEVMRHVGFDAIPADLPALGAPDAGSSASHLLRERIRDHLSACGLAEAIDFAFHDADADASLPPLAALVEAPSSLDEAGDGDGSGGEVVRLANPLSEKYALMRRSLLPGLVASALFNQRRGAEVVRLFEVGHLFAAGRPEVEAVGLVCGGVSPLPWNAARRWDFFAVKGVVEDLARRFGVELAFRPADLTGLLPGTAAEILVADGERVVGLLGRLDSDETTFPLFVAELATAALERDGEAVQVEAPSKYPGIEADATLTHPEEVAWRAIADAIEAAEVEDLEAYGLKDRYTGSGVPQGAVNTTIFFRYNAQDRSLTQEEINQRHLALVDELEARFGLDTEGDA
ncbi:MAG: phenylalanine--tRNA ligase subunit beta [Thermoanaerobaculia bacterium]|nr:phenylalanine--tRNA ligase subunit beta [Thermoanaerobaculia bacterium]